MKFGKRLKQQIEETLPEWRDKFLSYKDLKRLLRVVSTSPCRDDAEAEFVCLLVVEVEKLNAFFVEKEEDLVIHHKELHERIRDVIEAVGPTGGWPSEPEYKAEMDGIRRDIVNLHGEMVLLENYSNVNYTGLAKILKKYDKRTGRLLRLPFIEKVLNQPFFTTDLVSGLVKDLESTMAAVFPIEDGCDAIADDDEEHRQHGERWSKWRTTVAVAAVGPRLAEPGILRNTVAALATMRELCSGSSTYGHFSLPPLDAPSAADVRPSSPIPIQY